YRAQAPRRRGAAGSGGRPGADRGARRHCRHRAGCRADAAAAAPGGRLSAAPRADLPHATMFDALRRWRQQRVLQTAAIPDALWDEACASLPFLDLYTDAEM